MESWVSDSDSTLTSTSTATDTNSDFSESHTGGYISIPHSDSSVELTSDKKYSKKTGYNAAVHNNNYNNNMNYNCNNNKNNHNSKISEEDMRTRQTYKGQVRLDITIKNSFVTVHVIAGRNITSDSKTPPNSYVKVNFIPELKSDRGGKTPLYKSSTRPVFDAKVSLELPSNYKSRRLYVTLWTHDSDRPLNDELLGCMSFGLHRKLTNDSLASGWYYLLLGDIGRRRHVRVVNETNPAKSYSALYNISKVLMCRNVNNGGFGFSIYNSHPVKICRVDPGSCAAHHQLQKNDIIVCIDAVNVLKLTSSDVAAIIRNAGFYMSLMIKRNSNIQADKTEDKRRNGIIANCIKSMIKSKNQIRINKNRIQPSVKSKTCMTDYGWLEGEEDAKKSVDNLKTNSRTPFKNQNCEFEQYYNNINQNNIKKNLVHKNNDNNNLNYKIHTNNKNNYKINSNKKIHDYNYHASNYYNNYYSFHNLYNNKNWELKEKQYLEHYYYNKYNNTYYGEYENVNEDVNEDEEDDNLPCNYSNENIINYQNYYDVNEEDNHDNDESNPLIYYYEDEKEENEMSNKDDTKDEEEEEDEEVRKERELETIQEVSERYETSHKTLNSSSEHDSSDSEKREKFEEKYKKEKDDIYDNKNINRYDDSSDDSEDVQENRNELDKNLIFNKIIETNKNLIRTNLTKTVDRTTIKSNSLDYHSSDNYQKMLMMMKINEENKENNIKLATLSSKASFTTPNKQTTFKTFFTRSAPKQNSNSEQKLDETNPTSSQCIPITPNRQKDFIESPSDSEVLPTSKSSKESDLPPISRGFKRHSSFRNSYLANKIKTVFKHKHS